MKILRIVPPTVVIIHYFFVFVNTKTLQNNYFVLFLFHFFLFFLLFCFIYIDYLLIVLLFMLLRPPFHPILSLAEDRAASGCEPEAVPHKAPSLRAFVRIVCKYNTGHAGDAGAAYSVQAG